MASTFCFDRDFNNIHEWLGGSLDNEDGQEAPAFRLLRSFWASDRDRAGNAGKPMTLRSWRNPESVGGCNRKAARRKMLLRLRTKRLLLTQSADSSRAYLAG